MRVQYELVLTGDQRLTLDEFTGELEGWCRYGKETVVDEYDGVPVFVNEFWTAKQRAAHSLHESLTGRVSSRNYRGSFITRLTVPGEVVFDPFMDAGRPCWKPPCTGGRLLETTSIRCLARCLKRGWTRHRWRRSTPG